MNWMTLLGNANDPKIGGLAFFGIFLSLAVFLIGQYLFKISHGFFLFQPLFIGMILGILILWLLSKWFGVSLTDFYTGVYKPGGDIIFWFLGPVTIAFAVPLYRRNDVVKKFGVEILVSLVVGLVISLLGIYAVSKALGLHDTLILSMLPQSATTAIAMPISDAIGGNSAVTAMACILNGVLIYATADFLIKAFRLNSDPLGAGLGLGASGKTLGSAKAVELGSIQGATASIALVIISIVTDIVVPPLAQLLGLF